MGSRSMYSWAHKTRKKGWLMLWASHKEEESSFPSFVGENKWMAYWTIDVPCINCNKRTWIRTSCTRWPTRERVRCHIWLYLSFMELKKLQWKWPKKQPMFWEWNENKNNNDFPRNKHEWRVSLSVCYCELSMMSFVTHTKHTFGLFEMTYSSVLGRSFHVGHLPTIYEIIVGWRYSHVDKLKLLTTF